MVNVSQIINIKISGVNGMNMISLALQGPPNLLRQPATAAQPLQARAPIGKTHIIVIQS